MLEDRKIALQLAIAQELRHRGVEAFAKIWEFLPRVVVSRRGAPIRDERLLPTFSDHVGVRPHCKKTTRHQGHICAAAGRQGSKVLAQRRDFDVWGLVR